MALTLLDDPNADSHEWLREVTAEPEPDVVPQSHHFAAAGRDPKAGRRATKTIVKMILANVAVQVGMVGLAVANHWDPATSIKWSLFAGAFFYGVAACVVGMRSDDLGLRPVWLIGPWKRAVAVGACVGAALAIGLSAAWTLAEGRPVVDPFAGILAGTEHIGLLIAGALLIAVVAPLVEELVFRGFLTEAIRHRGVKSALFLSGVAFSLAHLRFEQFRYYLLMGIGLGALYWARGLAASIAAHAAFNGMLVILAIASVHGPTQTHVADQLAVTLPATWHRVDVPAPVDLAMLGPSGAQLSIADMDLPPGPTPTVDALALGLRSGEAAMPGLQLDTGSVRVVKTALGDAVRARAVVDGHDDHAVMTIVDNRLVVFELVPSGSAQAMRDFDRMLEQVHAA